MESAEMDKVNTSTPGPGCSETNIDEGILDISVFSFILLT
jgi:hypothetical protein